MPSLSGLLGIETCRRDRASSTRCATNGPDDRASLSVARLGLGSVRPPVHPRGYSEFRAFVQEWQSSIELNLFRIVKVVAPDCDLLGATVKKDPVLDAPVLGHIKLVAVDIVLIDLAPDRRGSYFVESEFVRLVQLHAVIYEDEVSITFDQVPTAQREVQNAGLAVVAETCDEGVVNVKRIRDRQ